MNDDSRSRFWDKFIQKTRDYGVNVKHARWLVIHAEKYISHYSNTRLQLHEAVYLEKYLTSKHSVKNMQKWRYRQIVLSLKILFTKMVHSEWSQTFPWDE